jgi:hypothetical protein
MGERIQAWVERGWQHLRQLRSPVRPLAALAAAAALTHTGVAADPYAGAEVTGNANYYSLICGTCPIDSGSLLEVKDGGPGQASAAVAEAGSGWSLAGRAGFDASGLPTLGGFAFADILLDPSIPKTFFYEAATFATALQRFDYVGTTVQTYRIDYLLEGDLTLGADDSASLMSAYGGLTVYASDYSPFGEFRGTVLDTDFTDVQAEFAGTHPFNTGGSVVFTLNPGDAFYVWAALSVTADSSHQVNGAVDAMHTLGLSFGAGDPSQLVFATAAPVPEPETLALLACGLLGMWARRRMHRGD